MDIASFKSFLKPGKLAAPDFVRFLRMMLQGLSTHVLEGDSEELATYRGELTVLSDRLSDNSNSEEILLAVSGGLRALDDYNRRTKRFILAQTQEMKTALRTTTETIAVLIQSRSEAVGQLTTVERKMVQASAIEDIREFRRKMQDCLALIQEEGLRLRTESAERIEFLRNQVEQGAKAGLQATWLGGAPDAVTGLDSRAVAEKSISTKVADGRACVVALFVVNRLATINRRFGREVGDDVLLQVAQHLGQLLPPNSVLFRWSGPSLAAVVDIDTTSDDISRKLARIASRQLEKNIDTGERSVFVPIVTLLLMQKVTVVSIPKDVYTKMDQFVSDNARDEQGVT